MAPNIVTRSGWGARAPDRQIHTTTWPRRTGFVVHHSATTAQNGASVIRGIQNFHMDTRRWGDIGYNWLVTDDGTIYEGRQGTWLAIGAHVAGHNTATVGVCWVGDSGASTPSVAARESIRWLYDEARRRAGRSLTRFYHGQLGQTACAGTTLNAWVAAGMPTSAPPTEEDDMLSAEEVAEAVWRYWIDSPVSTKRNTARNVVNLAYATSHQTRERADELLAGQAALHAAVTGQDPGEAIRAALDEHRGELLAEMRAELADVLDQRAELGADAVVDELARRLSADPADDGDA